MYFKITNKEENHHGFQYVDGLNVLKQEFNDDPTQSCCAGGLYFTDAANIFEFIDYGIYVREITLPTDNPDFKMVKDDNKWRANMIILGKRYDLFNVDTFKYLIEKGASSRAGICTNQRVLCRIVKYGRLDIINFLIENGANVHANNDLALRYSARKGYLDIVKILVENGANVHSFDDTALGLSAKNEHLDVVKYLVEHGANIFTDDDFALKLSAENGHTDVYEFLKSKC